MITAPTWMIPFERLVRRGGVFAVRRVVGATQGLRRL